MRTAFTLLVTALGALAAAASDGIGISAPTCIDTTDHAASAAAPQIETRACVASASAAGEIDTATPLSFVLIVR